MRSLLVKKFVGIKGKLKKVPTIDLICFIPAILASISLLLYAVFGIRLWVEIESDIRGMGREMSLTLLHIAGILAGGLRYLYRKTS